VLKTKKLCICVLVPFQICFQHLIISVTSTHLQCTYSKQTSVVLNTLIIWTDTHQRQIFSNVYFSLRMVFVPKLAIHLKVNNRYQLLSPGRLDEQRNLLASQVVTVVINVNQQGTNDCR